MPKSDEEIRKEWGYEGKPKQWQQGFDCGLKEIRLAESEKEYFDSSKYRKLVEGLRKATLLKGQTGFEYIAIAHIESLITEIESK